MQKKDFIAIANKYANNTATSTEKQNIEDFYNAIQEKQNHIPINLGKHKKDKIKNAIDGIIFKKAKRFNYKNISIAASIILLLGSGFACSFLNIKDTTIVALKGERKEILLADGSTVFLNANSRISYADDFIDKRNITLHGEAFFKVARNTKKPFTITANNTITQVLGTSFNINSTVENKTLISVNTGKLRIRSKTDPSKKVILIKNQQVTFLNNIPLNINQNNSDDLMAWTKNIIVLNNETLENTAKILENWYNVTIDIKSEQVNHETISGKFNNETLKNVIESIALLKNLKIDYLTPNHITIRKNE